MLSYAVCEEQGLPTKADAAEYLPELPEPRAAVHEVCDARHV